MEKAIIARKVGMTQIFDEAGKVIPVTVVEAGPCVIVQKKTVDKEGYNSVQMGFIDITDKKLSRPEKGHFAKSDLPPKKVLKEFRLTGADGMNVGDILKADVFAEGDRVDVTGTSKGKGYTGVIKRWNFGVQTHTHGVGPVHRSVGSTGMNSTPSKVVKGKKMAGQYGVETVTIMNLDVVRVDADKNIIALRGAIPGPKGGIVFIKNTTRA